MGMDHNLDLLKSDIHTPTHKLLDSILNADMLLTITIPTRIMQHSTTLIDIFISDQLQRNFDSAIIVDDISDHLPCIALMKQTRITDKSPLEWGSMACAKNLKSLFQVQKQCIRTLYKRPKRSNINELLKLGRILSIHDIIYLEMTVLGYKITHKMIPVD